MYEAWAETLGGLLQVAGVPGLLANAKQFRRDATDKSGEWQAFVAAWWARFGDDAVGVKDLFRLATEEKLLDAVLGDKSESSQRVRLGVALGKARGRVFGDYRICSSEPDHSCRQMYRLEWMRTPENSTNQAAAEPSVGNKA